MHRGTWNVFLHFSWVFCGCLLCGCLFVVVFFVVFNVNLVLRTLCFLTKLWNRTARIGRLGNKLHLKTFLCSYIYYKGNVAATIKMYENLNLLCQQRQRNFISCQNFTWLCFANYNHFKKHWFTCWVYLKITLQFAHPFQITKLLVSKKFWCLISTFLQAPQNLC